MIRVSDYIAQYLADIGVQHVFMVTGGGSVFLNDSLGNHSKINIICNHHEQACAMAAEGYARVSGGIGVINVTSGPGAINALNGVFGAWTDSIPMLIISGQVKRETCLISYEQLALRQLGDQEVDIAAMAKPITKYCATIIEPYDIAWHLDKALYLAMSGRPGPCWLDIPIDVQAAFINPKELKRYTPHEARPSERELSQHCCFILEKLKKAKRPVIMAGTGVRLANALTEFENVIRLLNIPVVTAWTHDLIASEDELYCGRPGTIGTRAGNFTVQNSDVLIVLGSRLNIRQTSYNWESFAKNAFTIQVDIDLAELNKPTYKPDHGINCDLKMVLEGLQRELKTFGLDNTKWAEWLKWCRNKSTEYPVVQAHQREFTGRINPYHFIEVLIDSLDENDIIVCGNATACIVPFQVARLKLGQRMFSNSGSASMGYELPAAIGAYFGAIKQRGSQPRIICLAGDGSLQMNIQELQTVAHHKIPIKIFVLNNQGYLSIHSSQKNFFGRFVGESKSSGVSFPDYTKVAAAYDIPSCQLKTKGFMKEVATLLNSLGPALCEVMLDESQGFEPRMSSRQLEDGTIVTPPLEDMYPFLDRNELEANMLHDK